MSNPTWQLNDDKRTRLNLQLFAEDGDSQAAPEVPNEDAAKPSSFEEAANAYLKNIEALTSEGKAAEPSSSAPAPTHDVVEILKGMGVSKFDSPEKVAKSYVELESYATKLAQERSTTQKTVTELQSRLTQLESLANQHTSASDYEESDDTDSEEDEDYDPQEEVNRFYENPKQYRDAIVRETLAQVQGLLQQQVAPVTQRFQQQDAESARTAAAQRFFTEHDDAKEFMQPLAEFLATDDDFTSMTDQEDIVTHMENALTYLKGQQYQSPDAIIGKLLSDDEMFNRYIAGNEAVRSRLLNSAIGEIKRDRVPPVITSPGTAQIMTKSVDKPASFEALGDKIKQMLGMT